MKTWLWLLPMLAILITGPLLYAQVENGINGTVTDQTGAVVPNARITITNDASEIATKALISSVGTFTAVGLTPGRYTVLVEADGFQGLKTSITVEVAKLFILNAALVPGATKEVATVNASSQSLNSTSPVLGTTLEPELVNAAPLGVNSLARQIDA